ncbi:MAG TPA: phosphoglycerate mutase family protein [Arenimonas sp.]|nr:phosphoglycerate mutase family protein [Arenimonas sp.]HOZ06193.1 phosphoglycerate mutase family protein [Arenimonas sp.]HPW32521.1 phosphoglycerate mutase family protein [Arenimonas sp.]
MKIKLSAILFSLLLMASPVMAADTMLIVVRHAEKSTDDPKDPSLSEQGNARARKLAEVLKNSGVKAVYTTQYKRTQQTGLPTASLAGLQLNVRPATKENSGTYTADLLKEIKKKHGGQTVLIVGHSNTVPEIVKYAAGLDVAPMGENEFDRIYLITLGKEPRLVSVSYNP